MTKQYVPMQIRWLEWDYFAGMDKERSSHLCYWVLGTATNDEYGLRLPGVEIEPGRGEPHRDRVLRGWHCVMRLMDWIPRNVLMHSGDIAACGPITCLD